MFIYIEKNASFRLFFIFQNISKFEGTLGHFFPSVEIILSFLFLFKRKKQKEKKKICIHIANKKISIINCSFSFTPVEKYNTTTAL